MKTTAYAFIFFFFFATLISCGKKSAGTTQSQEESDSLITITQAQFDAMGMVLGEPQPTTFREMVKVNGKVIASVNGQAQITSRVSGTIKGIHREIGDYVPAGSVICSIESNDYITLQEEYNAVSNSYRMAKANYERLSALYRDSIASKKDFQMAESAFKSIAAQYEALTQRLNLLKADAKEIEKGKIFSILPIRAPIGGYVTQINCVIGEYVSPEKTLMTLVDIDKVYLQLNVYEKDIAKLAEGQKVEFYNPNNPDSIYLAQLSKIGKAIDPEKKTIVCIADILSPRKSDFVNNMYVEAQIITGERQALGLPTEAVVKMGEEYRVYALQRKDGGDTYLFKSVKISVGEQSSQNIELKGDVPQGQLLVKGVYNMPAEM
jgi:cobalt-zinc-cadmium efflux system membrane fusion protein